MKLIVNTAALTPPLTGIGHYTANLLAYLLADGSVADIKGLPGSASHWLHQDDIQRLLRPPETTEDKAPVASPSLRARLRQRVWNFVINVARYVPGARQGRKLLFQLTAKRSAARYSDYLYWEPNYIALPLDNPGIITVHDLSHLAHPEFHPPERVAALTRDLERSVRQARRIIAVSEFTRGEIAREYGIDPQSIDIVSPAVGDEFRQQATAEQVSVVRQRYGLPEQYLLSVGTLEPRKNVEGLLRAYLQLPAALRQQYPLVLVGVKGWLTGALEQQLAPLVAAGEVRQLGYIDQADLPVIYQQASALAYVSFYEGFGMPVAEAMAAGTAVLTSNCASMPEVAQGAALLADPTDQRQLTARLQQLLSDTVLRTELSAKGQEIAQQYTWQRSGEKLLAVLRSAASDSDHTEQR